MNVSQSGSSTSITLSYVTDAPAYAGADAAEPGSARHAMKPNLSSRDRDTVEKIFAHPASGNVEWRQVVSLLEAIGTVKHEHNGKLRVSLGPETEVLARPHGKDVDVRTVVDLRRMLKHAGFGDGQRGEPT